ncbi:DUF4240 domain-containing protein [Streptomyces sp. 549]|uniref:DUF4240 domain-containing protein n=1 Tax=Streptomyces sp. 549 TaxID=3049076 RepID=UPI0024C3E6F5|nr:DUF4240 domain-containing protein [Streptomyces sp. 549]MDK1476766.1 DUF4240 domain-containing protein [Streptomyces sp. 549]
MHEDEFWQLIDATRQAAGGDPDEHAELLVDRLAGLDPDTVVDFARHFEARYQRSYRWDLWGAAWVLLDGASDDVFDSFRCWLIGQGRQVFEGALHSGGDALAKLLEDFDPEADGEGEDLAYAADEAYEQLTGGELPDLGPEPPADPQGTPIALEDDAVLAEEFPLLWARFRS